MKHVKAIDFCLEAALKIILPQKPNFSADSLQFSKKAGFHLSAYVKDFSADTLLYSESIVFLRYEAGFLNVRFADDFLLSLLSLESKRYPRYALPETFGEDTLFSPIFRAASMLYGFSLQTVKSTQSLDFLPDFLWQLYAIDLFNEKQSLSFAQSYAKKILQYFKADRNLLFTENFLSFCRCTAQKLCFLGSAQKI